MNLTNFLKQTDALTAKYSKEQLVAFIHDIGRVLPEHGREDFLDRLKAAGGKSEREPAAVPENEPGFDERYQSVRDHLKIIDSQEVAISAIVNEEYDEWYDDGIEEYYYEDESGISDMMAEACDFVHTCMDRERYQEGFEIGNQLFFMEILCYDDYGEEEISLGDLVDYGLLQCDLTRVILDTAYCAYRAVSLEKRPEALYQVLVNAGKNDKITLEVIMQYGEEELPDFQDFLKLWIAYLGTKTGCEADRFMLEAVGLLNDISASVQYAEKYVAVHPGLYLNLLEDDRHTDADSMASIGMEAMKIMPKQYKMRSRVALKTAEYLLKTAEDSSLLEKCYFVAYESDTSALNYLRAFMNGYGTKQKRGELQKVFMTLPAEKKADSYDGQGRDGFCSEREKNKPDENMLLLLRFLDGQFADVLAKGLNQTKALGWSGTFMKQGIALYLLYLYEGRQRGKGIAAMALAVKSAMGFSAEAYLRGIGEDKSADENALFYEVFLKWKSAVQMEPSVRTSAIEKIAGLLEKRVEGIMDANRRNYYGECAAYLAALGEVQESLGEKGAKQRLMTSYKDKYSRRSAFREEMRNYGWIDVKKK